MAATTAYVEFTSSVRDIGARTTSAGAAAGDLSAEEDRLINAILSEGALADDAFAVAAGSGMNLTIGSGVSKADLYAVAGDIAGQGTYIARLDAASVTVTASAADPSLDRIDEIWLVVADAPYDSGSVSLPRIGYRKGDAGGAAPGPDTGWKASAKLATITVPAAATASSQFTIVDERAWSQIQLGTPTGTLEMFLGATAPTGWLVCDGTAVSRTTYRRLFDVIGTTYGAGNGSTTFNLPDLRGRLPIGVKPGESGYDALGETGGAATKSLSAGELAAHTHTGPSHTHAVEANQYTLPASTAGADEISSLKNHDNGTVDGVGGIRKRTTSASGTGDTGSTGSGTAFSILPPYMAVHFIVKT